MVTSRSAFALSETLKERVDPSVALSLDTEILGAEAIAANPHKEPYPRRSGNLK
jgi:hypothetical protein